MMGDNHSVGRPDAKIAIPTADDLRTIAASVAPSRALLAAEKGIDDTKAAIESLKTNYDRACQRRARGNRPEEGETDWWTGIIREYRKDDAKLVKQLRSYGEAKLEAQRQHQRAVGKALKPHIAEAATTVMDAFTLFCQTVSVIEEAISIIGYSGGGIAAMEVMPYHPRIGASSYQTTVESYLKILRRMGAIDA